MELTENTANQFDSQSHGVFVPGDVLAVFGADFLDEKLCRDLIMEKLHAPGHVAFCLCPGCSAPIPGRTLQSFWECKRIRCDYCGKYFTALTGTFLSGCHFTFREIVLLAVLLAMGVADKQIAATLKISVESVRLWRLKFNDQRK